MIVVAGVCECTVVLRERETYRTRGLDVGDDRRIIDTVVNRY